MPPSATSTAVITASIVVLLLLGARESNIGVTLPSQGQYYQKPVLLTGRVSGENGYMDETPKQAGFAASPFPQDREPTSYRDSDFGHCRRTCPVVFREITVKGPPEGPSPSGRAASRILRRNVVGVVVGVFQIAVG